MSVINQMLRDLEARSGKDPARQAALAMAGAPRFRPPVRRWPIVVGALSLLGLAAALAAAAFWWGRGPAGEAAQAVLPGIEADAGTDAMAEASDGSGSGTTVMPAGKSSPVEAPVLAPPSVEASTPPALAPPPAAAPATPIAPAAPAVTPPPPPPAPPPRRQTIERVDPPVPVVALEAARSALAEGRPAEALRLLEGGSGGSPEAEALAAAALQQIGRHGEAVRRYRRAIAAEADVGAWWAGLAISLEAEGQGADALDAYRQAQRRGPLEAALADYVRERVSVLAAEPPR